MKIITSDKIPVYYKLISTAARCRQLNIDKFSWFMLIKTDKKYLGIKTGLVYFKWIELKWY
jgi:hypothetical protein